MKLDSASTWQTAVSICAAHNTTIISIHSPETNQAVAGTLRAKATRHVFSAFAQENNLLGTSVVWLGLHAPNARWQWADNSTYNYANWSPNGETNCGSIGGDCYVAMSIVNGTNFGTWTGYSWGGPDAPNGYNGWEPAVCVKPAYY